MMCWLSELAKIYADSGRPSIPPERLLRALLQAFYNVAAPCKPARLVLRQEGALRALSLLRGVEAMLTADGSLKPRLLAFYDNGVNTRPGSDSRGY
jgi:hypothetical protein